MSSAACAELVKAVQDDALTQRPRADLELAQVEDIHHRTCHESPRDHLVCPVAGDTWQVCDVVGTHLEQLGHPLVELGCRKDPSYERAVVGGSGTTDARQ